MAKGRLAATKKGSRSAIARPKQNLKGVAFVYDNQSYSEEVDDIGIMDEVDIHPERVRVVLAQAPARYSYWAALEADIAAALRDAQDALDNFIAHKYATYIKEVGDNRYTAEKAKMYWIMTNFPEAYAQHIKDIRSLEVAKDKAEVLAKSYEMQSRTLQTVGALLRRELELSGQA